MKTQILDPDPENDSETCCKCCGDEYALRDGCEPTKYCDQCAHKVVERLEREVEQYKAYGVVLDQCLDAMGENPLCLREAIVKMKAENQKLKDALAESANVRLSQAGTERVNNLKP